MKMTKTVKLRDGRKATFTHRGGGSKGFVRINTPEGRKTVTGFVSADGHFFAWFAGKNAGNLHPFAIVVRDEKEKAA